ncbi:hypothetical protein [Cellulomonas sp. NPDC089187]|uniref:hypothetical protein n=1 Tax=Cellulomonas sp. NPDC089187 TaxID=3154970 RepID=UPI003441F986
MRAAPFLLVTLLALAGCAPTIQATEPAESPTPTEVALSADDEDRAMWQCITFEWGYQIFPTADEAREHCEWLRDNNPRAFAEHLDRWLESYGRHDPEQVPDPDTVGADQG